jgi:hypothetical protein
MSEYLDELIEALEAQAKDAQAALRRSAPANGRLDPAVRHLRRLGQRLDALKELKARDFGGKAGRLHAAVAKVGLRGKMESNAGGVR